MRKSPPAIIPNATVCIIGTGAVAGAWPPVLRALKSQKADIGIADEFRDAGNCVMASLVYYARWASSNSFGGTKMEKRGFVALLRKTSRAICRELRRAERAGDLEVRSKFWRVMTTVVRAHEGGFYILTTNWDSTIERAFRDRYRVEVKVGHIHGELSRGHLYLPSEVANEPYRRSREKRELTGHLKGMLRLIEGCTRLVLYGLSLDPLDVELGMLIAAGIRRPSKCREVVVVDPKHDVVLRRIRVHGSHKRITIRGINPLTL